MHHSWWSCNKRDTHQRRENADFLREIDHYFLALVHLALVQDSYSRKFKWFHLHRWQVSLFGSISVMKFITFRNFKNNNYAMKNCWFFRIMQWKEHVAVKCVIFISIKWKMFKGCENIIIQEKLMQHNALIPKLINMHKAQWRIFLGGLFYVML